MHAEMFRHRLAIVLAVVFLLIQPAGAESGGLATNSSTPARIETDVCVYGGTSAGVAAAVQGARMGKRCVLVSPDKRLGGLTSNGLGWTDVGAANAIGGIAREFYHRIYLYYTDRKSTRLNSSHRCIS